MQLYNTRTRQKETFHPNDSTNVRLYCCGPTVYHYAHIGNLRTYVFEDILRRTLEFNGYVVNHVMNITDVGHLTSDADEGEDKMAKGAAREKMTVWDIAEKYTQAFLEDMDRLNLLKPTKKPKATDHVQEMIEQVQQLEKNGLTYVGENGNVYYDTSKFEDYGKLAQLEKQALQAGARIELDGCKKNPHDFVLWFVQSKHGEQDMQWDSPWGRGFPGWHMECSAMAMKYLGNELDIHCGGIDHVPVHHTNEIAQAEGATGKSPWVNVWMHGEFLVMKEDKMSKSKGNFLTINTLIEEGYDAVDYRYFCMQTHYRKQLTFSWEAMDAARTALRRLKEKVQSLGEEEGKPDAKYMKKFNDAVNDDLNACEGLSLLWKLMDDTNVDKMDKLSTIVEFDRVLGLKLREKEVVELPPEIIELILERNKARDKKDWAKADELREKIEASGRWKVKDGSGGTEVEKK